MGLQGLHLTADLYACQCAVQLMTDPDAIARLCRAQTEAAGLTRVDDRWVQFPAWQGQPGGVTGTLLLAESHLAIHTWPETGNVTLDVYVCNFSTDNSAKAGQLLEDVVQAYRPQRVVRNRLQRGDVGTASPQVSPAPEEEGWIVETLSSSAAFSYRGTVLERQTTAHQSLELLHTPRFGRVLRLDGRFMTSEQDEFFYHEALVHPAAIAHPAPTHCLIIGGGDGGAAEELLKHPSVREVVIAELDAQVIEVARQQLHAVHRGALDDARVRIVIGDGMAYVDRSPGQFDLILMDLTDPDTPAGALYEPAALVRLQRALAPDGALVLHLGSPVFHPAQVRTLLGQLNARFAQVSPYGLYIPLYGAYWGLAVASDSLRPASVPPPIVQERIDERGIARLQHYNADVHGALFALPNYYRAMVA
ncbi:MAG: polyamine aminopropyltransferase [Burkholderiaceae bacterium]